MLIINRRDNEGIVLTHSQSGDEFIIRVRRKGAESIVVAIDDDDRKFAVVREEILNRNAKTTQKGGKNGDRSS